MIAEGEFDEKKVKIELNKDSGGSLWMKQSRDDQNQYEQCFT